MIRPDTIQDAVRKGRKARIIRNQIEEYLISREYDIIQQLCTHHRQGSLTDDELRGSIGGISELRLLRETIESEIAQSERALEKGIQDG